MNVHVHAPHALDTAREHRPGAIAFKVQSPADLVALQALCAQGRTVPAQFRWDTPTCLVLETVDPKTVPNRPAPDPKAEALAAERARLTALDDKEFKTLVGERGVKWDKDAPRETMVDRVLAKAGLTAPTPAAT